MSCSFAGCIYHRVSELVARTEGFVRSCAADLTCLPVLSRSLAGCGSLFSLSICDLNEYAFVNGGITTLTNAVYDITVSAVRLGFVLLFFEVLAELPVLRNQNVRIPS